MGAMTAHDWRQDDNLPDTDWEKVVAAPSGHYAAMVSRMPDGDGAAGGKYFCHCGKVGSERGPVHDGPFDTLDEAKRAADGWLAAQA